MKTNYIPVACSVYDTIEALAVRRVVCNITYLDETGTERHRKSRIIDLYSEESAEYARLEGGVIVRLDGLVHVAEHGG